MNQLDRSVILKNRIDHLLSLEHHLGIFLLRILIYSFYQRNFSFLTKTNADFIYYLILHKFDKDINKFISDNIRKFYH